jgi:hypothetical protein
MMEALDLRAPPNPEIFGEGQPIDTAPQDGREILVWRGMYDIVVWHDVMRGCTQSGWFNGEQLLWDARASSYPTLWWPLPPVGALPRGVH